MANWYDIPASIGSLNWAAGLYIPNCNFSDYNESRFGESVTGDDGVSGYQSGFAGWHYKKESDASVGPYTPGNGSGLRKAEGFIGPGALDITVVGSSTSGTWQNHDEHEACVYSGMIPMGGIFRKLYGASWGFSFAYKCGSSYGGYLSAFMEIVISQYDENFGYLASDNVGLSTTASANWTEYQGMVGAPMHADTEYVMVQIAVHNGGSGTKQIILDRFSLFVDPLAAVPYRVMSNVYYRGVPRMSFSSPGVVDAMMMDGHLDRRSVHAGGMKHQLSLEWYREDGDTLNELYSLVHLSRQGWGAGVTRPVPVCVNTNFGGYPEWAYYHVVGDSFSGTFNSTDKDAGFDIGVQLQEV